MAASFAVMRDEIQSKHPYSFASCNWLGALSGVPRRKAESKECLDERQSEDCIRQHCGRDRCSWPEDASLGDDRINCIVVGCAGKHGQRCYGMRRSDRSPHRSKACRSRPPLWPPQSRVFQRSAGRRDDHHRGAPDPARSPPRNIGAPHPGCSDGGIADQRRCQRNQWRMVLGSAPPGTETEIPENTCCPTS